MCSECEFCRQMVETIHSFGLAVPRGGTICGQPADLPSGKEVPPVAVAVAVGAGATAARCAPTWASRRWWRCWADEDGPDGENGIMNAAPNVGRRRGRRSALSRGGATTNCWQEAIGGWLGLLILIACWLPAACRLPGERKRTQAVCRVPTG